MEINSALKAFSAIAQETRLNILKLLVKTGPAGVAAGDLSSAMVVAPPTMSFHLKELAAAGLILSRKEGRSVIYTADYDGVRGLVDFLLDDCCQGDPRLCGPYIITEKAS